MKKTTLTMIVLAVLASAVLTSCATVASGSEMKRTGEEQKVILFEDLGRYLPEGYSDVIGSDLYFVGSAKVVPASMELTKRLAMSDCERLVASYIRSRMVSYGEATSGTGGLGKGNDEVDLSVYQYIAQTVVSEAAGEGKLLFPAGFQVFKEDGVILMGGKVSLSSLTEIIKSHPEMMDELPDGFEVAEEKKEELVGKVQEGYF